MILRTVDLSRVARSAILLTGAASFAAWISGRGQPAGVAFGGAVMIANYHLIRMLVSRLIGADQSAGKAAVAFVAKLALTILLVAGAFYRFPIAPGSFAVGATTLLVAVILEACLLGAPVEATRDEDAAAERTDRQRRQS